MRVCLLCHGRLYLSSGTLTSRQTAVCDCGSSASLSKASRPVPQTSFGPLTSKPCVKALLSAVALPQRRTWTIFVIFPLPSSDFVTKIHRKGAPKPEVQSSSWQGIAYKNYTLASPSEITETYWHPCCMLQSIKGKRFITQKIHFPLTTFTLLSTSK